MARGGYVCRPCGWGSWLDTQHCVALDKWLILSEPQFPHLKNKTPYRAPSPQNSPYPRITGRGFPSSESLISASSKNINRVFKLNTTLEAHGINQPLVSGAIMSTRHFPGAELNRCHPHPILQI